MLYVGRLELFSKHLDQFPDRAKYSQRLETIYCVALQARGERERERERESQGRPTRGKRFFYGVLFLRHSLSKHRLTSSSLGLETERRRETEREKEREREREREEGEEEKRERAEREIGRKRVIV